MASFFYAHLCIRKNMAVIMFDIDIRKTKQLYSIKNFFAKKFFMVPHI